LNDPKNAPCSILAAATIHATAQCFADALPEGGHYYIWQNIDLLHELLQQQELSKAHFLGHSMGGVIASLFAGTFSDQVESLILLDSLGPMVDSSFDAPKQLAKAILDGQRESSPLRIFPSTQDALNARKKSSPGMTEEALLPIVERNLGETAGGYSWSTDSRLRQASKVRLTEEQVEGFFREIHSPVQLIIAEQGIIPKAWLEKRKEYLQKKRKSSTKISKPNFKAVPYLVGAFINVIQTKIRTLRMSYFFLKNMSE
jgi:pimeloyl-ACP methyl ester carboxylesterase